MPRHLLFLVLSLSLSTYATEQEEQYEELLNSSLLPATNTAQTNELPQKTAPSQQTSNKIEITDEDLALPAPPASIETVETGTNEPAAEPIIEPSKQQTSAWGPLSLLNTELSPNSTATLDWYSGHLPGGFELATPVVVVHGKKPGPRVCLTAAIHGDEVNGVEIARRVVQNLKAEELKGTIISVPVVNIDGLWRKDRYMSDRRDLNRAFPGNANGSTASRVAHSLFNSIIRHCDSLIDLHSGSMFRENISQLRADLTLPAVSELASHFGAIPVLQSIAPPGSLRGAATAAGIPAVVMEVGGPFTVDITLVKTGVKALRSYLSAIDMLPRSFFWSSPQPIFYASEWLRSRQGGILINKVSLGQKINKDQLLGEISNPITDEVEKLYSPFDAVVLGRAQDQFVSAGYAVFNLGERRSIEDLEQQGEIIKQQVVEKNAEQMGLNQTTSEQDETNPTPSTQEPVENQMEPSSTTPTSPPVNEEPPAESSAPSIGTKKTESTSAIQGGDHE